MLAGEIVPGRAVGVVGIAGRLILLPQHRQPQSSGNAAAGAFGGDDVLDHLIERRPTVCESWWCSARALSLLPGTRARTILAVAIEAMLRARALDNRLAFGDRLFSGCNSIARNISARVGHVHHASKMTAKQNESTMIVATVSNSSVVLLTLVLLY